MDQITFADVLQKSFVAMSMGGIDRITTLNIIINVGMSFLVGMFIFYIYRRTFQGVLYQRSFNISLVMASCVTTLVIMTISGNLVLSLGMVGALSIVRFRTPVKDSMDLVFLFWAISSGIANGVGYFSISVVGAILISTFLILMSNVKSGESNTYLVVIQMNSENNEALLFEEIEKGAEKYAVKSKVLYESFTDLTVEIRLKEQSSDFLNKIKSQAGVSRVTMITYEQDLESV